MIRGYEVGDAGRVEVQEAQVKEGECFAKCFDEVSGYSLVDDGTGEVLAVFSYQVDEDEIAWCYALIGKKSGRKMLHIVRFLRCEIEEQMKRLGVKKVCMTVKKGFLAAERLARLLGFAEGALCPSFYDGMDYQIFERSKI